MTCWYVLARHCPIACRQNVLVAPNTERSGTGQTLLAWVSPAARGGGEGGHSKSRSQLALPLRGPAPSCLPAQGSFSPAIPLVRIPPSTHGYLDSRCSTVDHQATVGMAERVGFEPTVELPRRMLSKHVDSATLAPLRMHTLREKRILAWPGRGRLPAPDGASSATWL